MSTIFRYPSGGEPSTVYFDVTGRRPAPEEAARLTNLPVKKKPVSSEEARDALKWFAAGVGVAIAAWFIGRWVIGSFTGFGVLFFGYGFAYIGAPILLIFGISSFFKLFRSAQKAKPDAALKWVFEVALLGDDAVNARFGKLEYAVATLERVIPDALGFDQNAARAYITGFRDSLTRGMEITSAPARGEPPANWNQSIPRKQLKIEGTQELCPGVLEMRAILTCKDILTRSDGNNSINLIAAVLEIHITCVMIRAGKYWFPYDIFPDITCRQTLPELPSEESPTPQINAAGRFDALIAPFAEPATAFYDAAKEAAKKDALQKILAAGPEGERFLLAFLLRDVSMSGGYFMLKAYGDLAHGEWLKKRAIVKALSGTSDAEIVNKLAEILMCRGKENQFAVFFQPAVAETLGKLKAYAALEEFIAGGQAVPAVLLAKDILRLFMAGVSELPENARDGDGNTPLHKAVMRRDAALVQQLLDSGADVDVVSTFGENLGQTALYMAVMNKDAELVATLLLHRANPSAADLYGAFPLQRAAAMGLADIVALLLAAGADKYQQTLTGKTALMWAQQNGHAAVAELLR